MSYFHSLRKKSNRRANCLDSFGYSCCCCLFDDDDANGDNDDDEGDDDDVSLLPQLMILLHRLTLLSNDHDCDFGCNCECDCDCDCDCGCECECDCKCDCYCASECYYYRFSFNFAKRKQQAKKKSKKQFVANLNEGLNGPLHFATHVARCTLYAARCPLQAANGSRQFAIESRCLKKPQPLIDFRIEDFPKGWIWIKSKAESSAAFMRSRSIRYVKYLNELRMDMQLSCHRQEKGEAEKEWERGGERVGAGWHASLTSWHVQLEASACLTLLWLTATRRHTIYDIRCSAYGIQYCTQCNCCWAGVKSIRDVATPKAVPCPTILCIIIIASKLWSPIMPW